MDLTDKNVTIHRCAAPDREIEDLYFDAFPPDERRPIEAWRKKIADGLTDLRIIRRDGRFAGFVTLWHLDGMVYVEHFAILPSQRGGGIGAAVISALTKEAAPLPMVLEVELPDTDDFARRRVAFYERCGLHSIRDFAYMQPPYSSGQSPLPMMLMASAEIEGQKIADQLYANVYI